MTFSVNPMVQWLEKLRYNDQDYIVIQKLILTCENILLYCKNEQASQVQLGIPRKGL